MKQFLRAFSRVALTGWLLGVLAPSVVQAQDSPTPSWTTLAQVSFEKVYNELLGLKVDQPVFSENVKNLDGQRVTLRGYVIPTEGYRSHKEFVFSAYPYSMCFFCGGAGPESVVEVFASEPIEYSAEAIVITGTLRLNSVDPNALMYRLEDAEMIEG